MSDETNQNGWNEYSRLVLKELESLSDSLENLNVQIQDVKRELTEIKALEDRVNELRAWKERISDVCSPSQLKDLTKEVSSLNAFKIKAVGAFIAVQFIMGSVAWFMGVF
jgi:predicted  nucleic acid-binding Zn-ribbon protein